MNPWEILGWVFLIPTAAGVAIFSYWFFAGMIKGARNAYMIKDVQNALNKINKTE